MISSITRTALLSVALAAAGGAMAQQTMPQQPRIEGVPAMTAPSRNTTSDVSRAEVRSQARSANAAGEADKGGRVASDLGKQDGSGQPARAMSRSEVQAQVRGQTDRIGGEADDLGRISTM